MRKRGFYFCFALVIAWLLASCTTHKKIPYLQGAGEGELKRWAVASELYDARIMPKDLVTITVSTTDPEASKPFNLTTPGISTGISISSPAQLQPYLVDNNGEINFPVLGVIKLQGLTKGEAEKTIASLLKKYIKEPPLVTVRFVNYKISVLGEVARPNTFTIMNEKVNLFEALAMAGDMTIWGRRDNVKLIREDANGNQSVVQLNLNDPNIILSPYYYLQQNDVLYVEPNKMKARNSEIGSTTGIWLSATSILISVVTLLVNIIK
jgi:polysaccharide export outer membrane protein